VPGDEEILVLAARQASSTRGERQFRGGHAAQVPPGLQRTGIVEISRRFGEMAPGLHAKSRQEGLAMHFFADPRSVLHVRVLIASLLAVFVARAQPASGVTLAIDLDPLAPGVQSAISVPVGLTFPVELVLVGDGVAVFDEVIVDIGYNDAGLVLASGPGPVVALALSSTSISWDVSVPTVAPPLPPPPAALASLGFVPALPFAASEGGFGYYTDPGSYPVVAPGVTVTVAGFSLTAVGVGTSTVAPTPALGVGTLFLGSVPLPTTLLGATVTVPEPATGGFVLIGLAALAAWRRSR
jgi:MYXO-CTERM domain-containing protein